MSRIATIKAHMISVPRPHPVWTAHEQNKAWNVILTEIRTDDGIVGYLVAAAPRFCDITQAQSCSSIKIFWWI
jgi:L-alanine-DL-glutamate epimerase-like enolase superfamily enzyme